MLVAVLGVVPLIHGPQAERLDPHVGQGERRQPF
jgi:hypothetical protein